MQSRRLRFRPAGRRNRPQQQRLRLRRQHEGGPARRPRGGARRAPHAQGRRRPHHPRPRAGHAAHRRPLRGGRPRSAGTWCPSTRACCTSCSSRPATSGGAEPGEMVLAEITRPPTATRNPAGRVLEVLGRLEDPGVDLKVIMAKYGLPDAFPPEVEAEAARGAHRRCAPRTSAGRTDFRPLDDRHRRSRRPRATTTTPSASTACPAAAGCWPCTSPTWRTTCAPGIAARPGGVPARHLGLLPGPRGADAAARALEQHLQPGGGRRTA